MYWFSLSRVSSIALLAFVFFLVPALGFAAPEKMDVGFMPGTVWLSDDNPVPGATVSLYTVLYNGSDGTLVGTVQFFDKTMLLGKREVSLASGEVKDVSINWEATSGSHAFTVSFTDAKVSSPGKEPEAVTPNYPTSKTPLQVTVLGKNASLAAQALGAQESSQLDTIDNLQKKVTDSIPPDFKQKMVNLFRKAEVFRMTMFFVFEERHALAEGALNKDALKDSEFAPLFEEGDAKVEKKETPPEQAESGAKTAMLYAKLGFTGLMKFLFQTQAAFYAIGFAMLCYLLRFIWRLVHPA